MLSRLSKAVDPKTDIYPNGVQKKKQFLLNSKGYMKKINCTMDDVRGYLLEPPNGKTPAAVTENMI